MNHISLSDMIEKTEPNKIFSELWVDMKKKAEECEQWRQPYIPKNEIQLLLVGESPPSKFGKYFYHAEDIHHMGLPAIVFRTLFDAKKGKIEQDDCEKYLKKFSEAGYLLLDLCSYPIDTFSASVRLQFIRSELDHFQNKIKSLQLAHKCTRLLVLPSATFEQVIKAEDVKQRLRQCYFDEKINIVKWSDLQRKLIEYKGQEE
jgi:hypothetical protein